MATRYIGHGSLLKRGATTVGLCAVMTPPTRSREEVEGTALSDSVVYTEPSDPPDNGELVVEQFWHDGDTNHELVDDDFDDRTSTTWSMVLANVSRTWSFSAWVKSIAPDQVGGKNFYKRTITFRINGAITRS